MCRKLLKNLEDFKEGAPSPTSVAEFDQWTRSARILLIRLAISILGEKAIRASAISILEELEAGASRPAHCVMLTA